MKSRPMITCLQTHLQRKIPLNLCDAIDQPMNLREKPASMIGQKNPPRATRHKLSPDSKLQSLKTSAQSRLCNLKVLGRLGKAAKFCCHNKNPKIIEHQNSFHSSHIDGSSYEEDATTIKLITKWSFSVLKIRQSRKAAKHANRKSKMEPQ